MYVFDLLSPGRTNIFKLDFLVIFSSFLSISSIHPGSTLPFYSSLPPIISIHPHFTSIHPSLPSFREPHIPPFLSHPSFPSIHYLPISMHPFHQSKAIFPLYSCHPSLLPLISIHSSISKPSSFHPHATHPPHPATS